MRRKRLILCGWVLIGSLASMTFAEEVFEPVRVVYLNSGKAIRCRIGWLEGKKMVCQKFNGTVSLPLQSINLEKTFPKFKKQDGETVLLVHPGAVYRDEHISVSDVRMIREGPNSGPHNKAGYRRSHYALLCDVMNNGAPCEVSISLTAKDLYGAIRHPIHVASPSRVGTQEAATLRKELNIPYTQLETQIASITIDDVQRTNIAEIQEKKIEGSAVGTNPQNLREKKIKALKEHFLKERFQSGGS
ncbi:MAG: hypothetical protein P8175_02045 [Deltaproteobacteria bacterium]|jgi:hypothetical protein